MPEQSYQDKTEPATPKRKREAREKGNIPRSIEVNSALILLLGTGLLALTGKAFGANIMGAMRVVLTNLSAVELQPDNMQRFVLAGAEVMAGTMAPLIGVLVFVGLIANLAQGGLVFSAEPITPKLSKINPLTGLKRMFSARSLVELIKGLLKISIVGIIGFLTIRSRFDEFYLLVDQGVGQIVSFAIGVGFDIIFRAAIALLLLAILDFAFQRYEWEKNLKMTKAEVKEEYKQTEGDPLIKSRIRSLQREQARRRMLQEVPQADVVITNPTHIAVAIMYRVQDMEAPKVVAKGARRIAEKIKAIAKKHDIPVIENPPLAQLLYKRVEVGMEIPFDLYQAVAEILAHVYQLKTGLYSRAYGKK